MASEDATTSTPDAASAPAPAPATTTTVASPPEASPSPAGDGATAPTKEAKPASAAPSSSKTPARQPKPGAKNYSTDPALYIYTSLTAGNMHIVTATSRLETILRANRVPFKATDLATDEKARMLWGRRAGKTAEGKPRRLPALVQLGLVLGDLSEIEEWNEYGELKQHVKIYYDEFTQPKKGSVAPVPKYKQPANKEAHPPAALNPPPPAPPLPNPAKEHAKRVATAVSQAHHAKQQQQQQPVKSVAEEAAERANEKAKAARQARIEALREKVHGAKTAAASGSEETDGEPPVADMAQLSVATDAATAAAAGTTGAGAGGALQSPSSGAWKEPGGISDALQTVQSPVSSSWKPPTETSLAAETFAGAKIASASPEEIQRIESEEAIKEEPEPESNSDEDKKKKAQADKAAE